MARAALLALAALMVVASAAARTGGTDSLVAAIRKKDLVSFGEALGERGLDVNLPSSGRLLPLLEAVRTRDIRFVQALLEQGAIANSKEPVTLTTPLHAAFQSNLAQVARLLLAHGADPHAKDAKGTAPRQLTSARDLTELVAEYDRSGPMGFEPAPGSWLKETKGGETYWWNPSSGEARWSAPPSCAWQRVLVQGHPIKYINRVTGQETTRIPPALSWTKVRNADGSELYLNWAATVSSVGQPAELPDDVAAEINKNVNLKWHNPTTNEYTYTNPAYSTAWRELEDEATGKPYYFNVETGESTWELPHELGWAQQADEATGSAYYFHRHTGEVSWTTPSNGPLSYLRHDSDL